MNTAFKQSLLSHIAGLFNGGQLIIGKGVLPSPEVQLSQSSIIAELPIPNDAFVVVGGTLQLNTVLSGVASSAGNASFFRLTSNDGSIVWQGEIVQGTVAQPGKLVLNNTSIIQGQAITVAFLEVSV